ncbi:MAG: AMP-binding protein [Pseudomonadota bacterium]
MNIAEWLDRTARLTPERPALFTGDRLDADYGSFAAKAASVAGALRSRGIGKGDRVAIFMANRTEYLIACHGVWWAGAAGVLINAKLHPAEAAWIAGNAEAALALISDDPGAGLAEQAPDLPLISVDGPAWEAMTSHAPMPRPEPMAGEELAWLFYTSGTTGRPKGVQLTHGCLVSASLHFGADLDQPSAEDCALYAAPISHGSGFLMFLHARAGARHCVPPSGGFDAGEILELAPKLGGVSMFAAPTMVKRLVEAVRASGSAAEGLRKIVYGGGPMYVSDIVEAVEAMGPRFVQLYGQGEAPMCITAMSAAQVADRATEGWRERLASVGRAQAGVEIKIGDDDGAELPRGETGEIMVRAPFVMAGYWENPEATAKALQDGWLRTGDVGRMDEDGFLWLTDRSKDMVITGGSNVYPREVEEVVLEHPDVREVSVVGRPHPEWGEELVAFVALAPGAAFEPGALDAHCLERIARFKRPKAWFEIEDLPKNAYGKVLKTDLRARLAQGA